MTGTWKRPNRRDRDEISCVRKFGQKSERMRDGERETETERFRSDYVRTCIRNWFFFYSSEIIFFICITHCERFHLILFGSIVSFDFISFWDVPGSRLQVMNRFLFNSIYQWQSDTRYMVHYFTFVKKDKQLHTFVDVVTVTELTFGTDIYLKKKKKRIFGFLLCAF